MALTKTTRVLLGLFALLALSSSAFAGKKDDWYKQALAAASSGNAGEAMRLYCQVAAEDASYKDANQNCNIMKQEAAREEKKNEERFQDCVKAFNSGDLETAEQKCRNVKSGSHLQEAQQYIAGKIPQAKAAIKAAGDEAALEARFNQGVQAYNGNNFDSAKSQFAQIIGKHQGEAQTYLNKIKNYQQAFGEAQSLEGAKNYKAAQNSYQEAANIKSDGPGDPRGKLSQMVAAANAAAAAAANTGGGGGGGGGNTTTAANTGATNAQPATAQHPVIAAIIQPAQPKIDVAKVLKEADAAKAKGDYGTARQKYALALIGDPRSTPARVGMETLPKEVTASNAKAGSELDVILVKGIGEFYQGEYEDAEAHMKDYIDINGAKAALGYFYRGASKLTRFYLGGEQPNDRKLLTDAQSEFRKAKKTAGFAPPDKFVSPRILKVFHETT